MPGSAPSDSQVVSVRRGGGQCESELWISACGRWVGGRVHVLSHEMFCLSDGRKQFLGLASRMCFKEAKKDCSYLEKSYIWNLYTDNKSLPLHLVHLSSSCFNFNFLSWASSRYLEFNHPKSGFHRSHEPVLGSCLSFIFSLHPQYHPAWLLSLWWGSLTSLSLPPSLSPLFTQSWACNRRSAKVSWVDKQMNESFVTSRFFPQTLKKDHRSRNDPGKSSTWLLDYFLDFKIHCFCSPPVSASCYFVPTASHHFLWACSWLESVGSSSVTKCRSWGYSWVCAHLEAGRGHPSCLLTSFSMGSLITVIVSSSLGGGSKRNLSREEAPVYMCWSSLGIITLVAVPLAKAMHMAKSRVNMGGPTRGPVTV